MKENKGKEVEDEAIRQEVQSQPRPAIGDKRKIYLKQLTWKIFQAVVRRKGLSIGHPSPGSSSLPTLPISHLPSIQIQDIDSSVPARVPSSKTIVPALSQPSQRVPMNLLENEDLAWERFEKAVTSEDMAMCYDMSLKEFEHSVVHDLFKVCN